MHLLIISEVYRYSASAYGYTQGKYSGSQMHEYAGGTYKIFTNPQASVGNAQDIVPTERFRLTSSGDVGIGTNNPNAKLNIYSSDPGVITPDADADELVLENGGNVGLSLLTAATGESSIYFGNPGTNGQKDGWIKYYHESHSTTADRRCLSFKTGGGSEKMRLDATGRLLINRTAQHASSSERLSVNGMTSIQRIVLVLLDCMF